MCVWRLAVPCLARSSTYCLGLGTAVVSSISRELLASHKRPNGGPYEVGLTNDGPYGRLGDRVTVCPACTVISGIAPDSILITTRVSAHVVCA